VVRRNPRTTFIGAHVGCYAENLGWVGELLDECPNFHVDISARIGELGRQPYAARKFFMQNSDHILFGSDCGPDLETYQTTYRFLETDDEYFNYNSGEIPLQGRWHAYGIFLPDSVLEKIYHLNAEKLFG
jgi:predicted TIM-barrel fold metal-dependent hydrolase